MDRLSILLSLMTGAVITGTLTIAGFAMGWYGWSTVIVAAVIGYVLAWPVAYLISRRIKRKDPTLDEDDVQPSALPAPNAREV